MSRRFLTPLNVLHLSAAPSSPETGDIYFDTTDDTLYIWNGDAWIASGGGGGGGTVDPLIFRLDAGTSGGVVDVVYDNSTSGEALFTYALDAGHSLVTF